MIFLIRKRLLFVVIALCGSLVVSSVIVRQQSGLRPVFFSEKNINSVTVIIDPGHGGEDGGAVSSDGSAESHLNLALSLRINDLLRFAGVNTAMTRTEDISIHTDGETIRARKASDIKNRVALVNSIPNAILLSIHQNSLPSSPVTHGAQAFWNQQEGGEGLAKVIQDSLNVAINPGNAKQPKQISPTIYLTKHATAPAVLVECGFLSNQQETALLKQPTYQRKLAMAITAGVLRGLAGEEIP